MNDFCIIHTTDEGSSNGLKTLKDLESWKTLLKAAKLRQHKPLLEIAENLSEEDFPNIHYHSKCLKLFTMKRDLESLGAMEAEKVENKSKYSSIFYY